MENGLRIIDSPKPGYFKLSLVKHGPIMPAIIYIPCPIDPYFGEYMDRTRIIIGRIGIDEKKESFLTACKIWNSAEQVKKDEYEELMRRVISAQTTGAPELYPYEPVRRTILF